MERFSAIQGVKEKVNIENEQKKKKEKTKKSTQKKNNNENKSKIIRSHPLIQTQTVYGNRATERVIRNATEEKQHHDRKQVLEDLNIEPIQPIAKGGLSGVRVTAKKRTLLKRHGNKSGQEKNKSDEQDSKTTKQQDDTEDKEFRQEIEPNARMNAQEYTDYEEEELDGKSEQEDKENGDDTSSRFLSEQKEEKEGKDVAAPYFPGILVGAGTSVLNKLGKRKKKKPYNKISKTTDEMKNRKIRFNRRFLRDM